jgi:hypothetical protein
MPLLEFEGCRQRIRRAKAHREAIAKLWNDAATEEDFYSVGVDMNDNGTGTIWLEPVYGWEFTNAVSLQLGEMLYQLRAALDSCIYGALIRETKQNPPPDENKLEFPICEKPAEYKAFKRAPLAQKRRDILESVQPYKAPKLAPEDMVFNFNRALGILSDWARKDRHRRLHIVGSWASNASPKIRCPKGTSLSYIRVTGSGFLEHKNEIATFRLAGYRPGMKVQANPDVAIDIAVDEVPPPCADSDTLGNRLRTMLRATYLDLKSIAGDHGQLPLGGPESR